MKIIGYIGLAVAAAMGAGCESVAQAPGATNAGAGRNVIESNGFRLVMNWCAVGPDRSA